jgi:hypothetical protein
VLAKWVGLSGSLATPFLPRNPFPSQRDCVACRQKGGGMGGNTLTLDSILSATFFFSSKWTPTLKRNQSGETLRLILCKLYGANRGSLFHARMRCSHAALADSLNLSREWTCKLIGRLREAGWITTEARRLPDGTQEITIFRAGQMLKRLLVMLLKSQQRQRGSRVRVNDTAQKLPTKEDVEKNKALLANLIAELGQKFTSKKSRTG